MFTAIRTLAHMLSLRVQSERGATAVEYGLMVALIAVVIIAAVTALGGVLNESFDDTCDQIAASPNISTTCP
jgi:pilus assembly protein Flp/PilA